MMDHDELPDEDGPGFELIEAELSVVQLQPGDVLVVTVQDSLTIGRRGFLQQRIEETFPGHRVLILTDGTMLGVFRPMEAKSNERQGPGSDGIEGARGEGAGA